MKEIFECIFRGCLISTSLLFNSLNWSFGKAVNLSGILAISFGVSWTIPRPSIREYLVMSYLLVDTCVYVMFKQWDNSRIWSCCNLFCAMHFGSNSPAGSNPGIGVRSLSWEFVSRCLFHYISMEAASRAQTFLYGL